MVKNGCSQRIYCLNRYEIYSKKYSNLMKKILKNTNFKELINIYLNQVNLAVA